MAFPSHTANMYEELPSAHSIRLLKPVSRVERSLGKLEFTIEIADLEDDTPGYLALSYTWGEARDDDEIFLTQSTPTAQPEQSFSKIFIDSSEVEIQENLRDALEQLEIMESSDRIWIDAVCINQQDVDERLSQVNLMRRIYGKAQMVLVWLGKDVRNDGEEIAASLDQLEQLSRDGSSASFCFGDSLFDFSNTEGLQSCGLHAWSLDRWLSLGLFLARRWFRRLWCLQEVLLAVDPLAVFVLFGNKMFPWLKFCYASGFLLDTGLCSSLSILVSNKMQRMSLKRQIGHEISTVTLIGMLLDPESVPDWGFAQLLTGKPATETNTFGLFVLLFWLTRTWETTDPRDRIYAMLGVYEKVAVSRGLPSPNIIPDYRKTPQTIFLETSVKFLEETNCLSLLNLVGDPVTRIIPDLPSWVPDYSAPGATPLLIQCCVDEGHQFCASNIRSPEPLSFVTEDQHLGLHAVQVGIVSDISELLTEIAELGLFELCMAILLKMPAKYHTGQCRSEVFWRTTICDCSDSNGVPQCPASDDLVDEFKSWLTFVLARRRILEHAWGNDASELVKYEELLWGIDILSRAESSSVFPSRHEIENMLKASKAGEDIPESSMKAVRSMVKAERYVSLGFERSPHRRLFLTTDNLLGLGPESLRPGDGVWIISGAQIPFILQSKSTEANKNTFQLLGEAYVHGIMHGEALEQSTTPFQTIYLA